MLEKTLNYFKEISQIPRCSKNEENIRNFLINWSKSKWFSYKTDKIWNLAIYVDWSWKSKNSEKILLQAHMDMVCVKTKDSNHDFKKDPIQVIEKAWLLKAKETSLWADNGIWIAMAMALSESENHPYLELLFTVDEEKWMSWALNLDPSLISAKKLINLDTEDEWEICISSAWWSRLSLNQKLQTKTADKNIYKISVTWFSWGHSGVDINSKKWNAIEFIFLLLDNLKLNYDIVSISWWDAENAIPRNAEIILSTIYKDKQLELIIKSFSEFYKSEFEEEKLDFKLENLEWEYESIENTKDLKNAILAYTSWVYTYSEDIEGLPKTSLNLWLISLEKWKLNIEYLLRSSSDKELNHLKDSLLEAFKDRGFALEEKDPYPGWSQAKDSKFVLEFKDIYEKVIKKDVKILWYHAGLECWAIVSKLWDWAEALSIWPSIVNPHTTNEYCDISSVEKILNLMSLYLER